MVCAAEGSSLSHSRNSSSLEIGCLVDTSTGLLTFTANGKEVATYYQVNIKVKSGDIAVQIFTVAYFTYHYSGYMLV